ncbi:hypothetical protein FN846DRAFT_398309 [Sphaerosporella brunnea]|uniref:Ca3427-like PBP 2 domain-containing protein n=1 Tax=Sphaerosporella brunnea TaxID=1250544 RepID=A0A5J5EG41_9PEZI|nr:hypothetical protein FN846DRAFT_397862 [Sphaerosporella brunnea]KAA8894672.1 hypothetical protein FN846DRAFT_398309 [Sphaerosporella brunnea]
MSTGPETLRVGYVPEHFSTPLFFAQNKGFFADRHLNVELLPYPSGTGAMAKSLESGDLDVAIGLTEGWIAALGKGADAFKLVGKYVDTPLCWAISTGGQRGDMVDAQSLAGGKKLGISRVGSGSYVMGYVLADQQGWLNTEQEPFDWVVLNDFKNLRDAVNKDHAQGKEADAFMWEHFTSKKYYDSNEIKRIGEIYTPWPSWHIVAHSSVSKNVGSVATLRAFLKGLDEGVKYFNTHRDEAVDYIANNLDYTAEDAREWLKTVEFSKDCMKVEPNVVDKTVEILKKAGVIRGDEFPAKGMVLDLHT